MNPQEFQALQDPAVLDLIAAHAHEDPVAFALRFHGRKELPVRAMAEQIACRRKASLKLPTLSRYPLLYTKLALEQASGQRAAEWKSGLMSGRSIIDLTGGLGIDDLFFARRFERVVACERDGVLSGLAVANREAMGVTNVEALVGDGGALLAGFPDDAFDWVYVDPARREQGGRSVGLEATSPDVVSLHDLMLRKAPRVCIKASPALEASGLQDQLPALASVIVVSVGGECKETLLLLDRGHPPGAPPGVTAVCLDDDGGEFRISQEGGASPERRVAAGACRWFYEPDAAIIKARLTAGLAAKLDLEFLNGTVDYLTSDRFVESFPGRSFRVEACVAYRPKTLKAELSRMGIDGAAIQRRDFPLSPDELRKRFRIREGSEVFLFFTRDASGALVCLICRKP
ncbi:MAG: hypothetical protein HGB02_02745 [Chlorobiaceae bacterium]|nr:hypothetical protein [Chlorobiaceae bacterium]